MRMFRRFMRVCFANAALIFLVVSIALVPAFFRSSFPRGAPSFHPESLFSTSLRFLLRVLTVLIFVTPPVAALLNGMAWWTLRTGAPSARRWAMAASISFLVLGIPLLAADSAVLSYPVAGGFLGLFILTGALFLLGTAGLLAFARQDAGYSLAADSNPPRIPGDGTHKALDAIAIVLQICGVIGLLNLYTRWGYEHDLPFTRGLESWIQWAVVILAVTILHESAHAVVGVAAGMELRAFVIGPFQFRVHENRWKFEFRPGQILALSGAAGLVPVNPDQSRWNEVAMIAAGPFSNLLTGGVAAAFAYSAEGSPWESWWEYFAMFATVSLVAGIVNLIPFRPESLYSDGARILQLFRSSPAADYHRVIKTVSCTLVSSRRPRDYDIHAIQRASAHFTTGQHALLLRLFATSYYCDNDRPAEASAELAEAEHIYRESASDAPADLYTSFLIKGMLLGRSPAWLREWWYSMEKKRPTNLNQDYWLAKAVFHWAENNLAAARRAWNTGQAYLAKLPDAGTYNYDRDCYTRIADLLDKPPVESTTAPSEPTANCPPVSEPLSSPAQV